MKFRLITPLTLAFVLSNLATLSFSATPPSIKTCAYVPATHPDEISTFLPLVGAPDFTLKVLGEHFMRGAVVQWNGAPRPTTFVEDGELDAQIAAADIAVSTTNAVKIVNSDQQESNSFSLKVLPRLAYVVGFNPSGPKSATLNPFNPAIAENGYPVDLDPHDTPAAVILSTDSRTAYVGLPGTRPAVGFVDVMAGVVLARVSVPLPSVTNSTAQGLALSPRGDRLYVISRNASLKSGTVSVIDTAKRSVRFTMAAGRHPTSLAVSPDGAELYVVDRDSKSLLVLDSVTGRVNVTIHLTQGGAPYSVAFSPDGSSAYVGQDDGLAVMDAKSHALRLIVPLSGAAAQRLVTVRQDGSEIYVVRLKQPAADVLDAVTLRLIKTIAFQSDQDPFGVAVTSDGAQMIVTAPMSKVGEIDVYDLQSQGGTSVSNTGLQRPMGVVSIH